MSHNLIGPHHDSDARPTRTSSSKPGRRKRGNSWRNEVHDTICGAKTTSSTSAEKVTKRILNQRRRRGGAGISAGILSARGTGDLSISFLTFAPAVVMLHPTSRDRRPRTPRLHILPYEVCSATGGL